MTSHLAHLSIYLNYHSYSCRSVLAGDFLLLARLQQLLFFLTCSNNRLGWLTIFTYVRTPICFVNSKHLLLIRKIATTVGETNTYSTGLWKKARNQFPQTVKCRQFKFCLDPHAAEKVPRNLIHNHHS